MISMREYRFAESLDEALKLLDASGKNRVLGGGMWLRLGHASVNTAIDLSWLGLDRIEETAGEVSIGAMATLRDVETAPCLNALFGGVLSACVRPIVGVQFRNMATVGASVYSRYGFSDLLTALLALDATVALHRAGELPLGEFLANPPERRDILTAVRVRKDGRQAAYRSLRRSATDFGVLNVCMSASPEGDWRLSVGVRPGRAMRCPEAEALLAAGDGAGAARTVAEKLPYGSNLRASADYRRHLAEVLTLRCWDALREDRAGARDAGTNASGGAGAGSAENCADERDAGTNANGCAGIESAEDCAGARDDGTNANGGAGTGSAENCADARNVNSSDANAGRGEA